MGHDTQSLTGGTLLPRGDCYSWEPGIVWSSVAADALSAASYYCIPFILVWYLFKRRDLQFPRTLMMVVAVLLAAGTAHAMDIWTVWRPAHTAAIVVKLSAAVLSLLAVFTLVRIMPSALALPTLDTSNRELLKTKTDLERSNRDLEQFAYVASHDLQEPLRMVAAYTQLLKQRYGERLDADARDFIDYAAQGALRMQALIDDLLAYSRLTTRARPFGPVDCDDALRRAMTALRGAIEAGGGTVTADPLPLVTGDDAQIGMVFQNLIANALKFRGGEPPRVHLSARRSGPEWIVSVQDNGIGIDPQYIDQVFTMFRRLHGNQYPGSGIGLATCKNIVERHGGRIWFTSEPDRGTTFQFTLPALAGTPRRGQPAAGLGTA